MATKTELEKSVIELERENAELKKQNSILANHNLELIDRNDFIERQIDNWKWKFLNSQQTVVNLEVEDEIRIDKELDEEEW